MILNFTPGISLLAHRLQPVGLPPKFIRFLVLTSILVAVLTISCNVGSRTLISQPTSFAAPYPSTFNATLSLVAEVISVDPITRTLVMAWYPRFSDFHTCTDSGSMSHVADIYLDPALYSSNSNVLPPYPPVYRYNWTCELTTGAAVTAAFTTESKLFASEAGLFNVQSAGSARADLQKYPFDVYDAPFVFYAVNPENGQNIGLNVSSSFGLALNFRLTLQSSLLLGGTDLYIVLRVDRTNATRIFVILVGITDWLITLSFVLITASTFIYPNHKIYSEMFVLPTATLFAFTSIRANLPGAPTGFGADIDLYTVLPVLIITSLCSGILLIRILYQRIEEVTTLRVDRPRPIDPFDPLEKSQWRPYAIHELHPEAQP